MELYIKVSFICLIIGIVLRASMICLATYPRWEEVNVGRDLVLLLSSVGFACWTGYLLFLK